MKKILVLLFTLIICFVLCACKGNKASASYKIGLGVVSDIASSNENKAQYDATVAAVVTDGNGKIVACKIDSVQNAIEISNGVIDKANTEFMTKRELGDNYGMRKASPIGKEWYEQADYFADYVIGMTVSDVKVIDSNKKDDVISAGCTIDISNFVKAIIKGGEDSGAKAFKSTEYNVGIGVDSSLSAQSRDAQNGEGLVKFDINISAVVTDNGGKVLTLITDSVEPEIKIGSAGVSDNKEKLISTKRELGENYGMKKYSGIGKEWFEQANAFDDYTAGLDIDGVKSIKTVEENGSQKAEDEYLRSGCTIAVDGLIRSVIKAIESVKK